jgi:hypothetical protein
MPLLDTVKALGIVKKVNSKILVACPGFPFETLFAYSFNGVFENGFDTAWIVTDQANQTVAVQFTHVSTKHAKVETPSFFGYVLRYTLPILLPLLILMALLFLR